MIMDLLSDCEGLLILSSQHHLKAPVILRDVRRINGYFSSTNRRSIT